MNSPVWFGRCIFLSFYCEKGTCQFCFRSVIKHKIKHPKKARRSMASILAEAMMIKAFGWRIEFLTGGYGILEDEELLRIVKLVSQILGEKIWINLGEISTDMLEEFVPYVEGIVSSIETVNPQVHKTVCPDKPIKPYEEMITKAKALGFKQSMTMIVGLGETKEDFPLLETFIKKHDFDRITLYALRPVAGTPFTKGPSSEDVAWWVKQTRDKFPNIEIIVGTAKFRIPEISLMIKSGADAITKLPATKIFNTEDGKLVEEEVAKTGREFLSKFTHKDPLHAADWNKILETTDLLDEEKEAVLKSLQLYLNTMQKRLIKTNNNA